MAGRRFKFHVNVSQFISSKQSAYQPFHSTETAVLSIHDDITRAIDRSEMCSLVFPNLSWVFDPDDHIILSTIPSDMFLLLIRLLSGLLVTSVIRVNRSISQASRLHIFSVDCSVQQGSDLHSNLSPTN